MFDEGLLLSSTSTTFRIYLFSRSLHFFNLSWRRCSRASSSVLRGAVTELSRADVYVGIVPRAVAYVEGATDAGAFSRVGVIGPLLRDILMVTEEVIVFFSEGTLLLLFLCKC